MVAYGLPEAVFIKKCSLKINNNHCSGVQESGESLNGGRGGVVMIEGGASLTLIRKPGVRMSFTAEILNPESFVRNDEKRNGSVRIISEKAEGEKKNGGQKNGHVADLAHECFLVFIVHAGDQYYGNVICQKEIG